MDTPTKEPKKLPKELKKNGFFYRRLAEKPDFYMYRQENQNGSIVAYEVFRKMVQKAKKIKKADIVINFEHKETFPRNEAFGKIAWTYTSHETALLQLFSKQKKLDEKRTKKPS